MTGATGDSANSGGMQASWDATVRLATIRYAPDTALTAGDAAVLIDALGSWAGAGDAPFAILADAKGVVGSDAAYRSSTTKFYRRHKGRLYISIFNVGPVIRVMAELFRIGSGLDVKTFAHEAEARAWLRGKGISA